MSRASCRSGTATPSAARSSSGARSANSCARWRRSWARAPGAERRCCNRLGELHDLDPLAAENLVAYLEDERESAGALPTDRRIVVQRFRDELGDWRLCLLTPFGARVHAPWALALEARLTERLGAEVQSIWSDDGIAVRLPEGDIDGIDELLFPDADEVEDLIVAQVGSSALFASRFRENAARALLLPRRRPGTRTPLWQQRQRAAGLLQVASRYGSFPILVETYRECLSDVFDLPALREMLAGVARREIAVHSVETTRATPFASSLLFDYIAAYMYEGDAPMAERRAQALTLDRDLLRELLGQEELRELLDPAALTDLELSLQSLTDERHAKTADQLHDLLRRLGDLSDAELAARAAGGARAVDAWLRDLEGSRRAAQVRIAGEARWIAMEDVARYRDAAGVQPPTGVPAAFLGPVSGALEGLLARWARTHGPFLSVDPARRWGLPLGIVDDALERLLAAGSVLRGEFRPGGAEREWCDPEVLRQLRRRSLARLRREVEPVEPAALGRFLPAWHGVSRRGPARTAERRRAPSADRRRSSDSPTSSTSCRACRCPPRSWSATSCRRAYRATSHGCSTSSARWARWRGWGAGASDATTAGSRFTGRGARRCGRHRPATPPTADRPSGRATTASAAGWPGAVRASTASCSRRPAAARIARSSTRCGISSGRARSRTTPSRRSGRSAGDGRRATPGGGRRG